MATGAFFAAFGYELWVATGTTASTIPTSTTGLTRILSLDNAGIQGSSDITDVLDYDSDAGFRANLVTGNSYTISCSMNLDVTDSGYTLLKGAFRDGGSGTLLRWLRKTPVTDASGDDTEFHSGLAFVSNFSEDITAGNVAKVTFDLNGYGAYSFYPQGKGIATLTVTTGGSGLTPASYTDVALVNSTNVGGLDATADITVAGTGDVTSAPTIVLAGTNYRVGDVVTVALGDVGGTTGDVAPTFTVATVS